MKIMHKSAALAAALILTAGISVQAADLTVNVSSTDGGTNSTGTVSGADIATALNGTSLEVGHLTVDGKSVGSAITNFENTSKTVTELYGKITAPDGLESQVSQNTSAISNLDQRYENTAKVVTELYGKITAPDGLESQVSQNTTQIGALDSQINGDNGLAEKVEVNGYKADTALKLEGNGVLYNHGTNLTTGINLNTSAIEQEEKDRVAADKNLQGQINTNASNIGALDNQINGDNGLAEKVEVNGYKADTALKLEGNGVLYNHGTDLTTGINLNTSAIEQEEKDRVAADLQLQQGIQNNSNAISSLNSRVSDLGGEIDNVGAISAALAGLHPLNYDGTGSKFQLAAAMGDYDGSQAAAIGGFYHFNEDVMMSVGGATAFDGDKKAAFNVGVSFRVGSGSSAKRLNSDDVIAQLEAMNNKIAALEAENQKLTEKVAALQDSEAAQKA